MCVYGEEEKQNKHGDLDDRIEQLWNGKISTAANETDGNKYNIGLI